MDKGVGLQVRATPTLHPPLPSSVALGQLIAPLNLVVSLQSALSGCQCLKYTWPSINGISFSLG